ncbi:MAG: potassium channel family protein, partial [Candidatus Desantisbacteria bacterium]
MKRDLTNQLIIISFLFIFVFLVGIIGFKVIGGKEWSLLDSLYMTVITMTTVGFGEVHPLSQEGRIFCIFLLIGGLGIIASAVSTMTAFLVEGELTGLLRRKKMETKLKSLSGHLILCGIGKVGFWIAEELTQTKHPFVVIEKNKNVIEEALNDLPNLIYIEGDATHNFTLSQARIEKAKGLIATLTEDPSNLFVTLSAKSLNPKLRII